MPRITNNNSIGGYSRKKLETIIDGFMNTGPTGETGDIGPTGPAGAGGTSGANGPGGAAGASGADGAAGASGANGAGGTSGADGAGGTSGANGPAGASGANGPAGANGAKNAIVNLQGKWRKLYCTEAPEVRFEDIIKIFLSSHSEIEPFTKHLDPLFVEACEPGSIDVVSAVASIPCAISAKVEKDKVICSLIGDVPEFIVVKVSGIRAGFDGHRFEEASEKEATINNKFWSSPHTHGFGWLQELLEEE